ncbi:MAG: class I SAM-dependent methyltransferase [archaeon]|nr:class I SAM-dependent methyltransferase [archaeon]
MKMSKTHAEIDEEHNLKKAGKIIAVLKTIKPLGKCNVLDIGTGSGVIARELSKNSKTVTSIDIADDRIVKQGYTFTRVKNAKIPFEEEKFDIVVSNHVIEHIPKKEQATHCEEIFRVLKKNGVCYMATPNKYWIIGKEQRDPEVNNISYAEIVRLTKKFQIRNLTIDVIINPKKFKLDMWKSIQFLGKIIPRAILEKMNIIFPTYIVLLTKNKESIK